MTFSRLPDPVPTLKQQLAATLVERLEGFDLVLGGAWIQVDRARLSNLRHGRLERFSLQRLVRMLAALGDEVVITTRSHEERRRARYVPVSCTAPDAAGPRPGPSGA